MATKPKSAGKTATGKAKNTPAKPGAAMADHSKDAKTGKAAKPAFGKAAPKRVAPAAKGAAAKAAGKVTDKEGSLAGRVIRKVKSTASDAVAAAASVVRRDTRKTAK